jgi:hypothetical protein
MTLNFTHHDMIFFFYKMFPLVIWNIKNKPKTVDPPTINFQQRHLWIACFQLIFWDICIFVFHFFVIFFLNSFLIKIIIFRAFLISSLLLLLLLLYLPSFLFSKVHQLNEFSSVSYVLHPSFLKFSNSSV